MRLNFRSNFKLAPNILLVFGTFAISLKIANFNNYLHSHMRGTFSSEKEAEDKWLPCKNEKELHKYLRK